MAAADNKELFRGFLENVVNQQKLAAFDDYLGAEFVEHEDISPFPPTREGARQFFESMLRGLPDIQVTVEDIVADGDKVWARTTWRGTHKGNFQGIPATNKEVSFSAIDIVRYADGKTVEHWGLSDTFGLMMQLGVISPPG